MPRILNSLPKPDKPTVATTTVKLAERMLAASSVVAKKAPRGFQPLSPMNLSLALYVAEESAKYPTAEELALSQNASISTVGRWLDVCLSIRLIERRDDNLALTGRGYDLVISTLEDTFSALRDLD